MAGSDHGDDGGERNVQSQNSSQTEPPEDDLLYLNPRIKYLVKSATLPSYRSRDLEDKNRILLKLKQIQGTNNDANLLNIASAEDVRKKGNDKNEKTKEIGCCTKATDVDPEGGVDNLAFVVGSPPGDLKASNSGPKEKSDVKKEKILVWKNLLLLCFSNMLHNTPDAAFTNIMSSLNSQEGIGLASESIISSLCPFVSLFLSPYVVLRWGVKHSLIFATCLCCPYFIINCFVRWETIVPSSVLFGIGDSIRDQAIYNYITQLVFRYSASTKTETSSFLLRVFGIYSFINQCSYIWGNLLTWQILDTDSLVMMSDLSLNVTNQFCGSKFCPVQHEGNTDLRKPEQWRIYVMCGIFAGMAIIAIVGFSLLLNLKDSQEETPDCCGTATAMVKFLLRPEQLMLSLITLLTGTQLGFVFGDYTLSYVSCTLGVSRVGMVMMCFGGSNAIFALLQSKIAQLIGNIPLMLLACFTMGALITTLIIWEPNTEQLYIYFVIASIWGMTYAVIETQIACIYGMVFLDDLELAYSAQVFWEGMGSGIAFGYSYFLCTSTKLYILGGNLVLGIIGYCCLQLRLRYKKKKALKQQQPDSNSHNDFRTNTLKTSPATQSETNGCVAISENTAKEPTPNN